MKRFIVFLWRDRAEWPYFGCWVGDAEVLEKHAEGAGK